MPYEVLNKKFRAGQKTVDREVSHVQNSINELEKSLLKTPVQVDQLCTIIGYTVEKLQTMKRKVFQNQLQGCEIILLAFTSNSKSFVLG